MTRDGDTYEQMVKDAAYQRPPIEPAGDKAFQCSICLSYTDEVRFVCLDCYDHLSRPGLQQRIATLTAQLALADALADAAEVLQRLVDMDKGARIKGDPMVAVMQLGLVFDRTRAYREGRTP